MNHHFLEVLQHPFFVRAFEKRLDKVMEENIKGESP
jgi:hypothetical protein